MCSSLSPPREKWVFPAHQQKARFTQSRKPTANRILIRNLKHSTMVTTCQPLLFFFLFTEKELKLRVQVASQSQLGKMGSNTMFFVHLCNSALTNKIQHDQELIEIVRGLFTLFILPSQPSGDRVLTPTPLHLSGNWRSNRACVTQAGQISVVEPRLQLSSIYRTLSILFSNKSKQAAKARRCDKIRTGFTELGLTT